MPPEALPRDLSPDDLRVGMAAEFDREITEADILEFARNSGDANPLHVDADYARTTSFGARVVHGAFQVGLASALIGMHLPGRNVLLSTVTARFPSALYFPCRVRVRGEITAWNREALGGQLKVTVLESTRQMPTAEMVLGFTFHEARRRAEAPPPAPAGRPAAAPDAASRRVVLVTGASGGIGAEIVRRLAGEYTVVALTHRQALDEGLASRPGVRGWSADLSSPRWRDDLESCLADGERLFGVVHAAWPGAPQGGLLQAQDEVIERQLAFGATATIRLARFLFDRVGPEGGRFVALGSIVGTQKPVITMAAYSLGKAALEQSVKLLAPELARREITINAVCPSFVPVGINRHKNEHQQKIEATRVPLGRLCSPDDVASTVTYLLSPPAGFLSGQIIVLSGGQL
jgi:3-oxoacyl-[acyl-carrier protein] reductase